MKYITRSTRYFAIVAVLAVSEKVAAAFQFGTTQQTVRSVATGSENDLAWKLIDKAEKAGQIGMKASEEVQKEIAELAASLSSKSKGLGTKATLAGKHDLVYSMSPGGSSGAIGPFVGKVVQKFEDENKFVNAVRLGPLEIELQANRKIMDKSRIKVKFEETKVKLFGIQVAQNTAKGQGVWKNLYVNVVERGEDRRLLRVMETPSLFIIQQKL
mmetsp:Transcript_4571/g.6152  ORF Transcript_4571/g.6152 Transcript_4571/m.6152 type:complete len:214 (+) Transcript_4571:85-726(+)